MVTVQAPGGVVEGETVAAQRTALGLEIGVQVQAQNANLAALAGLTTVADRLAYWTGSGTAALATLTAAGLALLDDSNATAQRATLGLVIGTDVQAHDAALASLAGLSTGANLLPYFNGSKTLTTATLTAAGRALLDDADASAQRTTLGLTSIDVLTPATTKGDLIVRGSSTSDRLAVGSNGQVLTADSSETLGVKWATPTGGGRSGVLNVTPSTSQNNYAPSGIGTTAVLELNIGASLQVTGISAGTAGDRLVLVNSSTDYLLLLPHESASSTAGNRFARPQLSTAASFVMPGDCVELVYTGSRWRIVAQGQSWLAWDDCIGDPNGGASGFPFKTADGGGVQTTDPGNLSDQCVGVYEHYTNTNANALTGLTINSGFRGFANKQGPALTLERIAVSDLSDGTETFQVYSGFVNQAGTDTEDALAWLYRAGSGGTNDTHWRYSKCVGGTETATASAATVTADQFVWLGVFANADWTRADFFYSEDGATWVFAGSHTSLSSAGARVSCGAYIRKLAGTTSRSLFIDCCGLRYDAVRA